ncbi:MAG TPA: hypothetical protein VFQ39_00070, partial [Longimicrobium sp.]|nr:hypothetical protein [Longimicrobium sp.]
FVVDGLAFHHRHESLVPGTIAQHASAGSLTALHEFAHALSSYSNGLLADLYVDGSEGVNNKHGRPIPATFASYDGAVFATDPARDGLGYPEGWRSYHCQLHDPEYPAIIDDYWQARDGLSERCQHDQITRRFLLDRVRAKLGR